MPTSSPSGGSLAPMENSPPGIQAMPLGIFAGGGPGFGTVGPKSEDVFASADGMAAEAGAAEGAPAWTEDAAISPLALAAERLAEEIFQTASPQTTSSRTRMIGRLLFTASSFVNHPAADDGGNSTSGKVPAVEGGVLRFRKRLRGVEGPLLLRIEDSDV